MKASVLLAWLVRGVVAGDLPEGPGLAAAHPGDRGVARHESVLFAEDFEVGALGEVEKRWGEASNRGGKALALLEDGPFGGRCLEITATLHENTGGHLYTRLKRPVDVAFARFYVKFPGDPGYVHHFVHLGGYEPPTPWPQGGAGTKPRGDERFTVGIEPFGRNGRVPPPGEWNFYAYWHEMKVSADGRHWGNGLAPAEPRPVPRGRWQCVEVMLKGNTVPPPRAGDREAAPERDGELALWLDGKLVAHVRKGSPRTAWTGMGFRLLDRGGEPFEGFSWRRTGKLKVNFFWLLHYVTPEALRRNGVVDPPRTNAVRFDHVVVATAYVGPAAPPPGR
jgi:hypothetical protein